MTGAQALIAIGKKEGKLEGKLNSKQQTLLELITQKFGDIPTKIVATFSEMPDVQISYLLANVLSADSLSELGL